MAHNKISKREFLKKSALSIGALSYGFCNLNFLSKAIAMEHATGLPSFSGDLDKWSIEAKYYVNTPKGLKCQLCPNKCNIKPDEEGDCRTKINVDGKLYSTAYGNPCAVHVDPIEKKPLYHFYPTSNAFSIATAGCNLACLNCQNWEISQTSPQKTRNYDLMPEKVVEQCLEYDCKSIAYTYSEPIAFYEYTLDTAKIAREKGVKNIIVSAGYIHEKPLREWCKYIDAANIDLKSFSNETYEMLNAGTLEPVLNTLKILKEEGVWLEITNLIVPSWTDDLDVIKEMCEWLAENGFKDSPLHFSRFHPQYQLTNLPATPVSTLEKARYVAIKAGINYIYIGNVPGSDAENTFCPNCNKIIIKRKGYRLLENNIENGKCKFCKTIINGIWD
ncbi:MAG: AmmeMemoRadiSam system radical SAM enzyme [Bacteroidales bacterium]|nr:AmmeMemoRadiSam system radical SAM enzyme [Bacteroidales bacterium]